MEDTNMQNDEILKEENNIINNRSKKKDIKKNKSKNKRIKIKYLKKEKLEEENIEIKFFLPLYTLSIGFWISVAWLIVIYVKKIDVIRSSYLIEKVFNSNLYIMRTAGNFFIKLLLAIICSIPMFYPEMICILMYCLYLFYNFYDSKRKQRGAFFYLFLFLGIIDIYDLIFI